MFLFVWDATVWKLTYLGTDLVVVGERDEAAVLLVGFYVAEADHVRF